MKLICNISLPLCMVLLSLLALSQSSNRKPNIILIVADDLGYGELGCYGQQKILTPNIDALSKRGKQYTQFYAGTAVCAPSRASLLTGMHTGHTTVRGNRGFEQEGQFPLGDTVTTIASLLQASGYTTAAFGKWGLGYPGSSGIPSKQGFAHFYGYNCQTLAHNYYPDHLWQNETRIELPNKEKDSIYSGDLIHEHAMRFLQQQNNQPFFLFLPYTLPHGNLVVPHDSLYRYYVNKFMEEDALPRGKNDQDSHVFEPQKHAAFAAMVSRLDKYVGEVVNMVHKKGWDDNTLIIFTSDNGPHKENGGDPVFFNSSGNFRGIKRDLYEGGIRIPFIVSWKNRVAPGSVSMQVAAFWDLFPTLQEAAGISVSTKIDGISLLPSFTDKPQKQHAFLYWEFHENNGRQALRYGKWKAVMLNVSELENPNVELYDIDFDPLEKRNVAAENQEVVQQVRAIMQQAHVPDKNWPLLKGEALK